MHRIKWLLVEWEQRESVAPHYGLINVRSLVNRNVVLHTGKLVIVGNPDGSQRRAKIVISSDDRRFLEQQLLSMQEHSQEIEAAYQRAAMNGISNSSAITASQQMVTPETYRNHNEHQRYSASLSSWSYSDSDSETNPTVNSHAELNNRKLFEEKHFTGKFNGKKHYGEQYHTPNKLERFSVFRVKAESSPVGIVYGQQKHSRSAMTYDQGMQTIESGIQHQHSEELLKRLEVNGSVLELVIEEMEKKLSQLQCVVDNWTETTSNQIRVNSNQMLEANDQNNFHTSNNNFSAVEEGLEKMFNIEAHQNEIAEANVLPKRKSFPEVKTRNNKNVKQNSNDESASMDTDSYDMVPIGMGKSYVPKTLINQIDWNSHTIATRKLLMALFPRRTLATHSLTGKSSPAFLNKPAKNCLDPDVVNDIVLTVTANCGVKESLVRSAITTKLADENKMYRMRLEKTGKRLNTNEGKKINQENIPPIAELKPNLRE